MKKLNLKAFTLVEMLIVIVIIGILIAALLPRLQGAQNMARDTSRRTALSQIQSAIIAYQSQFGKWPELSTAKTGTGTNGLSVLVSNGIMTEIPTDPNLSNVLWGLGTAMSEATSVSGQFLYMVTKKNSITDGGFILMAKTETPGNSNWVIADTPTDLSNGKIDANTDISNVITCKTVEQWTTVGINTGTQVCTYQNLSQLRYLITY